MSTVAVTGAKGFIGAATCQRLEADGHQVVSIDLPDVDVTDLAALERAFTGCDLVVHTVALLPDRGGMADHVRVNVGGTRNVMDAAERTGVERVLHVSSVAVWGYEFGHDLEEDAPPRPCGNPYIDTKGTSELLARSRGATVVRPGDVYGPRSEPWAVRPVNALKSGMFVLPGAGDGLITPVYIDDLVDCLVRALTMPDAAGGVFTCWDGEAVTARDFFAYHASWTGRTIRTAPEPLVKLGAAAGMLAARAAGKQPDVSPASLQFISRRAVYPNARAREVLGWQPEVPLDEGMRRVEEWLRREALL
jgi:nucleoside-diphosphate-sugar epimerase